MYESVAKLPPGEVTVAKLLATSYAYRLVNLLTKYIAWKLIITVLRLKHRQTDQIFRFNLACFCLALSFFQEQCLLADFFAVYAICSESSDVSNFESSYF